MVVGGGGTIRIAGLQAEPQAGDSGRKSAGHRTRSCRNCGAAVRGIAKGRDPRRSVRAGVIPARRASLTLPPAFVVPTKIGIPLRFWVNVALFILIMAAIKAGGALRTRVGEIPVGVIPADPVGARPSGTVVEVEAEQFCKLPGLNPAEAEIAGSEIFGHEVDTVRDVLDGSEFVQWARFTGAEHGSPGS